MTIEILVPDLPESVADATVATWHKKVGDHVKRDEVIVEIETDKVILEVPALQDGVISSIVESEGATVLSKQLLATIVVETATTKAEQSDAVDNSTTQASESNNSLGPVARRLLAEHDLHPNEVQGSGVKGRITRQDVETHLVANTSEKAQTVSPTPSTNAATRTSSHASTGSDTNRAEKRVPMTRLRKTIANRLLEAKNNTAMLTTFNEVNMKPIMDLRKQYQETFEKRHGVRLGFMSFYVKAVTEALKRYPEINASIDGDDVVYHNFFDISMAVSTPRGLVTPVLKDCDLLSFAQIEQGIKELAQKGQQGKLTVDDLIGGNFTITNGGVFGSLMSTPIINPPQSAILGMHKIQDRPMAVNGQVEILPMMYLALSYDHRLIDGKESVGFLVTVKELLEEPARLLLEI